MSDDMHDALSDITFLIGTWRGEGHGSYPTIDAFTYGEEITFLAPPRKPLLAYSQRTWHAQTGISMHAESGYLRAVSAGRVELVVAHPFGIIEIEEGTVAAQTIELMSTVVGATSTAKPVTQIARTFTCDGDILRYSVKMAAVGLPLGGHLQAELRRVS